MHVYVAKNETGCVYGLNETGCVYGLNDITQDLNTQNMNANVDAYQYILLVQFLYIMHSFARISSVHVYVDMNC